MALWLIMLIALLWVTELRADSLSFRHMVVDANNPADPHCKGAGDLDGDGYPDLTAASASGGGLYWYRYPDWTKHRIADGSFTTDMAVADIDGDGFMDIVIPSDEGLLLFRNPRSLGRDPKTGPWPVVNIAPEGARMHDICVADLNGDGKPDLITRRQSGFGARAGNLIHLWVQESPTAWKHRSFPCPHGEGLATADLTGDGRPDVIIGGRWYEHPGNPLKGEWKERLYMPAERFDTGWTNGDVAICAADLDGDRRPEIVLTPAEGKGAFSQFVAPKDPCSGFWQERIIEEAMDHAHALAAADMDKDGHIDLVVAKMHQATAPQEVAWFRNSGRGTGWRKEVISTRGSHNIVIADIGKNGRPDVFGANWNNQSPTGGALDLWLNEGPVGGSLR